MIQGTLAGFNDGFKSAKFWKHVAGLMVAEAPQLLQGSDGQPWGFEELDKGPAAHRVLALSSALPATGLGRMQIVEIHFIGVDLRLF